MHLVLYRPQVPGNTGSIGRLCIGLEADLHLIGPIAFDITEKAVRRAGLDYWHLVKLTVHADDAAFLHWLGDREPWLTTRSAARRYDRTPWRHEDVILFGNEQAGLPKTWCERWTHRCVALPILGPIRSYNLACSAAIIAMEAHRACGAFDGP